MAQEDQARQEGPSVQEMLGAVGAQLQELTRSQQAQAAYLREQQQTIAQLAQGTQQMAQRASTPPTPTQDDYQKANEKYLQALALDPIALRRTETAQIRQEMLQAFRQELGQAMGQVEQGRRAEDLERQIYQANPDIAADAPTFNYWLGQINQDQRWNGYSIADRINAAIQTTREHRAARQEEFAREMSRNQQDVLRASAPGGGSFRDPGTADGNNQMLSPYDAHRRRFEMMEGRKAAAMGGGGYRKK